MDGAKNYNTYNKLRGIGKFQTVYFDNEQDKITIAYLLQGTFVRADSFALEQLNLHRTQGTCVRTDKLYHSAIICFEHNRMCTETVCKEKDIIHIVCTVATFVCTVVTLWWIW